MKGATAETGPPQPLRALSHLVRADFLERVRRTSFLMILALAVYLGYTVNAGYWVLRVGDFKGVPNSAWVGSLTSLLGATWLSWIGFYLVRGSVRRDRETGVGQILAATPMTKIGYVLAKTASNFAVLAAMVAVLAVAALVLALTAPGSAGVELWPLLAPFVFLALPAVALAAAAAVFFECMPGLRGGVGNMLYFFLWPMVFAGALFSGSELVDPSGFGMIFRSQAEVLRSAFPGAEVSGMALQVAAERTFEIFEWQGVDWNLETISLRLVWFGVAGLVGAAAAAPFGRFDPSREFFLRLDKRAGRKKKSSPDLAGEPISSGPAAPAFGFLAEPLSPFGPAEARVSQSRAGFALGRLVAGELRLALKGQPWWWYTGVLAFAVAEAVAPREVAVGPVLVVAAVWPILVWSPLGGRAVAHRVTELLNSSPSPKLRQVPTAWMAGVAVALAVGGVAAGRLALTGDAGQAVAVLAGLLFPPALALALGTWSGTTRVFEIVYLAIWYVGPLNGLPYLDFLGTGQQSRLLGVPAIYVGVSAVLLLSAMAGRNRH